MDKPFSWTNGAQSFNAVLHLSWNGSKFIGADVTCRNMVLNGLSEDQFLQLCYQGIGVRADSYDVPDSPAPNSSPAAGGS